MKDTIPPLLAPGIMGYYGNYPVTILRHVAHGLYEMRLPGGDIVTDFPDLVTGPVKGTHYAVEIADLMAGTYYLATGGKRHPFAFYARGVRIAGIDRLPDQRYLVVLDAETAKPFLPK